jgi:hypothetical protein
MGSTEHDAGELLEYDAEAQRWAVELSEGGMIRVCAERERERAHALALAPGVVVQGQLSGEPPRRCDAVSGKDPEAGGQGGGGISAAQNVVARALNERLAKFEHEKPATFFTRPPVRCPRTRLRGERCPVGDLPEFPTLASPGAANWGVGRALGVGGEARGGRVCWATCGECAGRRGLSLRQWADTISRRWACLNSLYFVPWLSKATTP